MDAGILCFMQNPINDWNAEFQVPLAENLELLNLVPRAFPLKNGKALGTRLGIKDCAIIIRRGAEKQELSSKNLDSTPPPSKTKKKIVLTPLCYVKNNVAHPLPPPRFRQSIC